MRIVALKAKFGYKNLMHGKSLIWLIVLSLALSCSGWTRAADLTARVEFARMLDGSDSKGPIVAAVLVKIPEGYHAYAHERSEMGRPANLDFALEGSGSMPVWYPPGEARQDTFDPAATAYVYHGEVALFSALPVGAESRPYSATLDMLLCSPRNCTPFSLNFTGNVPENFSTAHKTPWLARWQDLENSPHSPAVIQLPQQQLGAGNATGQATGNIPAEAGSEPAQAGADETQEYMPSVADTANEEKIGKEFGLRFSPRYASEALEVTSLGHALLIGLLAGILLNAMPCVLPVLTLKVSGMLLLGGGRPDADRLRHFREHNLFFAAGIFTLFTVLALVLGAANLMWGQLFQNQGFLLVMLLIVFLMGLSMLGVFTLPVLDLRYGQDADSPRLRSYLTGLVATFLATPCSGPLLGGVLGWAFTQPLAVLIVVFWSVGLGMGLPYVMFCIWPDLARILPRPGPWMYIFEHILGFCLLGTALYLLSVLPAAKHLHVLSVLLLVAFCAWLWGRFCGLDAPPIRRRLVGAAGALLMLAAVFWILRPVAPVPSWKNFTPEYFESMLGRRNLLVEFTADWCPNCKFMEAMVFTDENLRKWEKQYNMELVRVDLTRPDSYAARLLENLGSRSIPLTALFPAGEAASSPFVLRDVYGADTLSKALENNFSGQ